MSKLANGQARHNCSWLFLNQSSCNRLMADNGQLCTAIHFAELLPVIHVVFPNCSWVTAHESLKVECRPPEARAALDGK